MMRPLPTIWPLAIFSILTMSCAHPLHTSPLQMARESPFIAVTVLECYDGDTCTVTLSDPFLPAVFGTHISVRLEGIDTPELKGRCPEERTLAVDARAFLRGKISHATRIDLRNPRRDKYFRLLARLVADGEDLSDSLLTASLARPYHGGTKQPWCPTLSSNNTRSDRQPSS